MKSSKVKMIPEWVVLSCLSAVQIVNWELCGSVLESGICTWEIQMNCA